MPHTISILGRWIRRAAWAVALLAVLYLGADLVLPGAASPVSETSSLVATSSPSDVSVLVARDNISEASFVTLRAGIQTSARQEADTTPTYISELAPALMVGPQQAAALPASGAESSGAPWPKLAGLVVALLGALFIYAALNFRTSDRR